MPLPGDDMPVSKRKKKIIQESEDEDEDDESEDEDEDDESEDEDEDSEEEEDEYEDSDEEEDEYEDSEEDSERRTRTARKRSTVKHPLLVPTVPRGDDRHHGGEDGRNGREAL